MTTTPRTVAVTLALVLGGLLVGCAWVEGDLPSETPTAAPEASSRLSITAPVGAVASGYAETELTAPAGVPLTIEFTNQDEGIGHNVEIYPGPQGQPTQVPAFAPVDHELVPGGASTTYEVPPLPPGIYTFLCYPHPATMRGTLTVR